MKTVKRVFIDKDIELVTVKDTRFKTNAISVYIERPIERDEVTKASLVNDILKKGCEKYPSAKAVNRKLDSMYGSIFYTSSSKQAERYVINAGMFFSNSKYIPEDIFPEVVSFINEIINRPLVDEGGFNKEIFEIEKNNLKDFIEAEPNNKSSWALKRCVEIMCEGEKYSISSNGYVEDLEKIDRKELYRYYKEILATSKIQIFIEGDIDVEEAERVIRENLKFERGEIVDIPREKYLREEKEIKYVEEKMQMNQGNFVMGFALNNDARNIDTFIPVTVGNIIFGGGPSSKLFENIREKNSLCYYISSGIHMLKGLMFVSCGIDFENDRKVEKLILENLEAVKNGDFTDEELENAKLNIINDMRVSLDSLGGTAGFIRSQSVTGRKFGSEEMMERVKSVTREEIMEQFSKIRPEVVYFLKGEV